MMVVLYYIPVDDDDGSVVLHSGSRKTTSTINMSEILRSSMPRYSTQLPRLGRI